MSTVDPLGGPPRRPNFDGYLQHGPARPARAGQFVQNALVIVGLALVARVGWSVWQVVEERFPAEPQEQLTAVLDDDYSSVPSVAPLADTSTEPNDSESEWDPNDIDLFNPPKLTAAEELDWAKTQQRKFLQDYVLLGRGLSEWRKEERLWRAEVVPLLENKAGKSLAAKSAAVQGFRAIYRQPRPELSRATEIEELARELTRGAQRASVDAEDDYIPEVGARELMSALDREAWDAANGYREGRQLIAALVVESRDQPAGVKTLRAAMEEAEHEARLAAVEEARERMETAQKAADAQIAEAKEQVIRQAGEAEAARILAGLAAAQAQQAIDQERHEPEQAP
jgi:hypothetical protein